MDTVGTLIGLLGAGLGLFGGLCAVVVPLVLLAAFGIFFYRRSKQAGAEKQAAQAWPHTKGTVLSSTVETRRTGNSSSTYPVVVYQYQVNGKTFQSQIVKAGEQFMSVRVTGQARKTVARYPAGASVTVYYNPANPGEAALER